MSAVVVILTAILGTRALDKIDQSARRDIPLQARLVAAVSDSNAGILEVDGQSGRVLSCTGEAESLLGRKIQSGTEFERVLPVELWHHHFSSDHSGVSQGRHQDLGVLLVTSSSNKVLVMVFHEEHMEMADNGSEE